MSPVCSNCGDLFDEGPPVCPHCGADADQDWTDDSYTPEFDFETGSGEMDDHSYGEFIQAEGLNFRRRRSRRAFVGSDLIPSNDWSQGWVVSPI